ncbi:GNAT family N-acetyltransferase [Ruminococcus flavefaciens]|uniref:GNAT family N-acetyltransferase n=1 Tax=Ruminococcus flavefaciens TaxID=1265 RepID=UPI0026EB59EC|nr:GNAT family N-acetyltransferase [Ruminococcus flavefaciens]MDD7517684.1 GNAT family N-acetyltransferase [Ruminococcus flavefaciens]MDY5693021.1 GNAT family N-acetyltransferase [Ruminococcus flavefaciens]
MKSIKELITTKNIENNIYLIQSTDHILEILTGFQEYLPPLKTSEEYRRNTAEKISNYAFCILLKEDDTDAGFGTIYANDTENKTGYISFIAVSEDFRRRHFGTRLMDTLVAIAYQNQMEYVKIEVAKTNHTAQSFYLNYGYQYQCDAGNDSVYMILKIADIKNQDKDRLNISCSSIIQCTECNQLSASAQ